MRKQKIFYDGRPPATGSFDFNKVKKVEQEPTLNCLVYHKDGICPGYPKPKTEGREKIVGSFEGKEHWHYVFMNGKEECTTGWCSPKQDTWEERFDMLIDFDDKPTQSQKNYLKSFIRSELLKRDEFWKNKIINLDVDRYISELERQ